MVQPDVVVVGAGISGMSLAWFCAQAGKRVTVLESRPEPGGCIQTHRFGDRFWFELGAHTCYNSYGALLSILEKTPGLDKLLPREKASFRLLAGDEIQPISKHLHVLELLGNAPRLLSLKKEGRTARDYYSRIVGERNYQEVFSPLFATVFSQRADDFPADMIFKKRPRRKDVLRSWTMQGGLQSMAEAMARAPNVVVRTSVEARALRRDGAGFAVEADDGVTYRARFVALAVPPSAGAPLIAQPFPALSRTLAGIEFSRIKTVGVAARRDAVPVARFAGVTPLDGRFYSAVSRDTVTDPELRGFAFHFKPETRREQALAQIASVLKVDPSKFEDVVEREVVLPSPRLGHEKKVAEIDAAIAGTTLLVTGNYFAGLSIEDCVQRSRSEAERMLKSS